MSTSTIQATTGSSTSASPSNNLASKNGQAFILFDHDWLKLQSFITSCLQMPITTGDFASKYGTFSDQTLIDNCVTAMQSIQAMGTQMGDPSELRKKVEQDPNYLSGPTPPTELFGHCAWMAAQLSIAASNFHDTWSDLKPMYMGNTPAQNKTLLDSLLTGSGGLKSTAKTSLAQIQALQGKLSSFQSTFSVAKKAITKYCDQESQVIAAAKSAENVDTSAIATLTQQATEAHKKWEDYTIAASTASIGIAVISMGILWPVAAAVGGGLGAAAAAEMKTYNNLMGQIGSDNTDLSEKTRLVTDLTAFNLSLVNVDSYLSKFADKLATIEGVWLDQNTQLTAIADLSADKIGTYSGVVQATDLHNAMEEWKSIANNTNLFVTDSLVDYSDAIVYPTPVPSQG
ncbi:hypothetical protein J4E76_06415 [Fabibacter sp. E12]|nr:hypothetical protein [Roseivirga sp. E12]